MRGSPGLEAAQRYMTRLLPIIPIDPCDDCLKMFDYRDRPTVAYLHSDEATLPAIPVLDPKDAGSAIRGLYQFVCSGCVR